MIVNHYAVVILACLLWAGALEKHPFAPLPFLTTFGEWTTIFAQDTWPISQRKMTTTQIKHGMMLFDLVDRRWHVSQTCVCVCVRVFRSLCAWCVCITTYVVGSLILIEMWQWRLFTANARVKIWRLRSNSIGPKNINQRTTRHNNRFSLTIDQPSYLGRGVFQKNTSSEKTQVCP